MIFYFIKYQPASMCLDNILGDKMVNAHKTLHQMLKYTWAILLQIQLTTFFIVHPFYLKEQLIGKIHIAYFTETFLQNEQS